MMRIAGTGSVPSGVLRVHHDGPVAWIVIDRPDRRNALSPDMWAALPSLLRRLDADPAVRVIGLRGAGAVFSSGADLTESFDCLGEPDTGLPRGGLLTAAEAALSGVRKPTVAALEGYCMGGAWMLAGACDLRVASKSLRIGLTPARIGIVFPASGVERLVSLVGSATASYLLLTGDTITAEQAYGWGMLTKVAADKDFEMEVRHLTEDLAARSQLSVQAHKHLIRQAAARPATVPAGSDAISEAFFHEVLHGSDARIGHDAFFAKQRPTFEWTGEAFWNHHGTAVATASMQSQIMRG